MENIAEKEVRLEQLLPLILETLEKGHTVSFAPRGISMLPMLHQGRDTVTLAPISRELKKYDLPLYRRDDGAFILHRIVAAGETFTCIGDNQYELERGVRRDQMIAVVTSFTRNGHLVEVTDLRYQLYCRFWHWSRPARRFLGRVKGFIRRKLRALVRR